MTSISTAAFYARATGDIAALRARAEGLQGDIARGERLTRSSQDPIAAARLRALSRADASASIDAEVASRASADLQLADDALTGFTDAIARARELATQAASGTLNADQRKAIGVEIAQLNASLFSLANARDSAGHALFGGEATGQAYTLDAAGNATYVGTASAGTLDLGDGQSVTRGVTGPEFLNSAATDLFSTLKDLADALNGGIADPAAAARNALTALDTGLNTVTTAQTVVGVRLNRIELASDRAIQRGEIRDIEQAAVGGTDIAATVTRLQETLTVLEASQAGFARLSALSLFNQIR